MSCPFFLGVAVFFFQSFGWGCCGVALSSLLLGGVVLSLLLLVLPVFCVSLVGGGFFPLSKWVKWSFLVWCCFPVSSLLGGVVLVVFLSVVVLSRGQCCFHLSCGCFFLILLLGGAAFPPPPRSGAASPPEAAPFLVVFLADLASQGGIRVSKLTSLLTFSKVMYNFGTYPGRFWQHAWSPSSRLETRTTEPNMCVISVRFSLCLSYVILSCCLRVVSVSVSVSESVSVCLPKFPSRYVALNSLIRYIERRGIGHVLFSTYSQSLMGKIQWSLRWISGASDSTSAIFRWAVLAMRDEPNNGLRCSSARSSDTIKGCWFRFMCSALRNMSSEVWWTSPLRGERSHHKVYVGELAEGPFTHCKLVFVPQLSPSQYLPFSLVASRPMMVVLARTTMKEATKCDKHCELHDAVNHKKFDRTLCFRVILENMPSQGLHCVSVVCVWFKWFVFRDFVFFYGLFSFFHRVLTLAERHLHTHTHTRNAQEQKI